MEIVTGTVGHIIFRNEDNGYTAFRLHSEKNRITVVGTFFTIAENEYLKIYGNYGKHPFQKILAH